MAEKIGLEAVLDVSKYNRGVDQYLNGLDKMNKGTSGFDRAVSGFGTKAAASFQNLGKIALGAGVAIAAAGAAAGVAIGKFAIDGIKKAADLESQLSSIAATLNMTKEQVAPLNDLILKLGLDPNLKVSATEAADAIENLARNGLSMAQIMDGAAHSVVLLANATGAEFGQAADITTDVMAQFNIKAEEMGQAVNQITAVTNLSKFTIDDYGLAIAQAGGVASSVGVSFEDFNTTIAATSPLFASGSDAGTSFKTFLTSLNPKSAEAADLMKSLGLSFFDANGQMKSMADISEELNRVMFDEVTFTSQVNNMTAEQTAQKAMLEGQIKKTNMELFKYSIGLNGVAQSEEDKAVSIDRLNRQHEAAMNAYSGLATSMGTTVSVTRELTEAERMNVAQTIFGSDAMRTAFGLAEAGAVIYTDVATAMKELGATQEEVNAVIEGGVTQFEALQIQMGHMDAADQAATRMDNFKGSLEILQGAIETVQIQIGQAFLPLLQKLAGWASEFVSQHGPAVTAFFAGFAENLSKAIEAITNAQSPFEAFSGVLSAIGLDGNAVALSIGAIVAAVGLVLQPVADAIGSFVEWKDVLIVLSIAVASVVIPAIVGMVTAMAPIILIIGGAILAVAALRTAWENDWLGIQTKTIEAISAIQTAFEPFTAAVQTHMQGALAEVKAFTTGNETEWTHTKAIWEGLKESVSGVFGSIIETVTTNLPLWKAQLVEWGMASTQWILNAAAQIGTYISSYTTTLLTEIGNKLPEWTTKLTEWSTAAGAWLATASAEAGTKLGEWYTALSGALSEKLASWMTAFDEWTTATWDWIVTAAGLVAGAIGEWYTALSGAVATKLTEWATAFAEWSIELYDWIKDSFPLVKAEIGAWYTTLTGAVAAKLKSFASEMLKWAKPLVDWIQDESANPLANLGKWLGDLVAWIPTGATLLAAAMLKMATALVSWIGDRAANALPELGKWLGKILGWIIGTGVPGLIKGVVDLAGALIGWISGTGGVSVEESAQGKLDAEFEKFKGALGTAIQQMWEGIKGFVQAFGQSFWDELGKNIDWFALGMTITSAIQSGVETVSVLLTGAFKTIATEAYNFFFNTDWLGLGLDVISSIKSGVSTAAWKVISELGTTATKAIKEFIGKDWVKLGADVIAGILKGLRDNAQKVIDYLAGLAKDALDAALGTLGIQSPSKVFIKVGEGIIQGWLVGLETGSVRLVEMAEQITQTFTNTILRGTERAVDAFSNILDGWSSVGSGFADSMQESLDAVTESFNNMLAAGTGTGAQQFDMSRLMTQLQTGIGKYQVNNRTLETLKQQAELIDLIRESGGQPATVLAGIALGRDADPQQLLDVVNRMMEAFNGRLENSIKIAAQGFQELVDSLRQNRRTIEQVEAEFADTRIDNLEYYKREVLRIDEEIAKQEQILLTTGNQSIAGGRTPLQMIADFNYTRAQLLESVRRNLEQTRRLENTLATLPVFRTERAQAGADAFRERFIDPLVAGFSQMSLEMRESTLGQINRYLQMLQDYSSRMQNATAATTLANKAVEGFGEGAQQRVENLLAVIYDVGVPTSSRDNAIQTLRDFATALNTIRTELTTRNAGREDIAGIIERATASFDQLADYRTDITDIDKRIQALTNTIEETGNVAFLPQLRDLDAQRLLQQNELKNFLIQMSQLEGSFRDIKNLTGPGETSAQRFVDEQIQPILDAFSAPMRPQERQAWLMTAQQRVAMVNKFIDQMRAVEKLQQRIANVEGFEHLVDEFASIADIAMPEVQRVALLNTLTVYISQMERLFALQKDLTVGLSASPFVEQFKSERLDTIAKQLENINLSEAERGRLIEQYRMEQEKVLEIQRKQSQLDFLKQQLDLLNQVKDLDDKFGDLVPVADIFAGVQFGVNASLDSLVGAVSKAIDAMIRVTNRELGIASPSKVFERIGQYMMGGLARGIETSVMRPINSLSGAISELPYALGGRSLTLNMGGVSISNGMDEVMFEARVRQILDRAFP